MNGMFYTRGDDRDVRTTANEASSKARRASSDIDELERRIDRMALLTESLWILLRERVGLSEDELLDMAREIDLSDGRLDGKVDQAAVSCPACDRVIGKRHTRCIYCGQEIVRPPFGSI